MASLTREYESLFDNIISAAQCLDIGEYDYEEAKPTPNTPKKMPKRVEHFGNSGPAKIVREVSRIKHGDYHDNIDHKQLNAAHNDLQKRRASINLKDDAMSCKGLQFEHYSHRPYRGGGGLYNDDLHTAFDHADPFGGKVNQSFNNACRDCNDNRHSDAEVSSTQQNSRDNKSTASNLQGGSRRRSSSNRDAASNLRVSQQLHVPHIHLEPTSTTQGVRSFNFHHDIDAIDNHSQVSSELGTTPVNLSPPIELLVDDQDIVQDWRKAKQKHDEWKEDTSEQAKIMVKNTAVPQRVTTLLNSRDCELIDVASQGRTGVNAFNDKEGLYKALVARKKKEQKKRDNMEHVFARLAKRSKSKGSSLHFKGRKVHQHETGANFQSPVNINMSDGENKMSPVQELLLRQMSPISGTNDSPLKTGVQGVQALHDVIDKAVIHSEADTVRKMQRLVKRRDALGLIAVVDFIQPREEQINRPIENRPEWIQFNVNRVIEDLRFELPFDLCTLQAMTPLHYLTKHTRLSKDFRAYIAKYFTRQLETSRHHRKTSLSVSPPPGRSASPPPQQPQQLSYKMLYTALNDSLGGNLGIANYQIIKGNILDAEVNKVTVFSLQEFLGLAAYCQRKYWSMYANTDEGEVFRPMLEVLDFSNLRRKLGDVAVSAALRTLFNSLAGRRTTEESNMDHFW